MSWRWRSMLFVPAAAPQRWAKAHTRGADALIVDLEDSTQPEAKAAARSLAHAAIATLAGHGADVTCRINNDPVCIEADIAAAVQAGLKAVVLPKCETPEELATLDRLIAAREQALGLGAGQVKVIAVIESPRALERLHVIADGPRLVGVSLGSEDFALALGRAPSPLSLDLACRQIAYATAARGLMGIAMACSIADYSDLASWEAEARRAHGMGLSGAMCIHPNQVAPLNHAFAPGEAEIAEARAILAAWEGRRDGVVALNGRMIDQPVVERARRLLAQAGT